MKLHLFNRVFWQSMLSILVLGIFLLIAVSSLQYLMGDTRKNVLPTGECQQVDNIGSGVRITTGLEDDKGNWHGMIKIVDDYEYSRCTEDVYMEHGVRQGLAVYTYKDGQTVQRYYVNGTAHEFIKAGSIGETTVSAFQILENKYPYYKFSLNTYGFSDTYIKSYLDTVEIMLSVLTFGVAQFDKYYEDEMNKLEETPYDSLMVVHSDLVLRQGLNEIKSMELRLAVIDRYRSAPKTTYQIITTTYPNYLISLNDSGVVNKDFELFCHVLDSTMNTYGALKIQDPFFVDSVDARLFRALFDILDLQSAFSVVENTSLKNASRIALKGILPNVISDVFSGTQLSSVQMTPKEVAGKVVIPMGPVFLRADILRRTVKESWMIRRSLPRVSSLATVFISNSSASDATLRGYITDDGGAPVTARGMVYAPFYNPDIRNSKVSQGTGTGEFTVTLTGLTKGTAYYVRAFATNSAGTAYGNLIRFVADNTVLAPATEDGPVHFNIFPNPAYNQLQISFDIPESGNWKLSITDMKGQEVFCKVLGYLPEGINRMTISLGGLSAGIYECLIHNGSEKFTKRLVISR